MTHQFGVELLWRAAAVHCHEGLRGRGDAAVVQVERSLALRARTVLWTAGEQRSVLRVNLKGGKLVSIEIQEALDAAIKAKRLNRHLTSSSELFRLLVSSRSR